MNPRRPGGARLNEAVSPMTLEPAAVGACPPWLRESQDQLI